jgi:hypothetical protein
MEALRESCATLSRERGRMHGVQCAHSQRSKSFTVTSGSRLTSGPQFFAVLTSKREKRERDASRSRMARHALEDAPRRI